MILGAFNDSLYKLLFLGPHDLVRGGLRPGGGQPGPRREGEGRTATTPALGRLAGHLAGNGRQIHFPALLCLGAFGIGMVLTSDDQFGFGDTWVSLAFLVWLAICGIITGVMLPGERKLAAGDASAEKVVERAGQLTTLLLLVMLYLMIWKPGA